MAYTPCSCVHRAPISYNHHMLQVAWDTWPLLLKPLGVILGAGTGFLLGAGIGGCGVLWNLLVALFAVVEASWHTAQQGIAALLIADPANRKAAAAAAQPKVAAAGARADTAAAAMDPTACANAVAAAACQGRVGAGRGAAIGTFVHPPAEQSSGGDIYSRFVVVGSGVWVFCIRNGNSST